MNIIKRSFRKVKWDMLSLKKNVSEWIIYYNRKHEAYDRRIEELERKVAFLERRELKNVRW